MKTQSQIAVFLSGKVSYKQLLEKREKVKNDKQNLELINEAIKVAEEFIEELKQVDLTEA